MCRRGSGSSSLAPLAAAASRSYNLSASVINTVTGASTAMISSGRSREGHALLQLVANGSFPGTVRRLIVLLVFISVTVRGTGDLCEFSATGNTTALAKFVSWGPSLSLLAPIARNRYLLPTGCTLSVETGSINPHWAAGCILCAQAFALFMLYETDRSSALKQWDSFCSRPTARNRFPVRQAVDLPLGTLLD